MLGLEPAVLLGPARVTDHLHALLQLVPPLLVAALGLRLPVLLLGGADLVLLLLDELDELVEFAGGQDDGARGLGRREVEGDRVDGRSLVLWLGGGLFEGKLVEDDRVDSDGVVDSHQLVGSLQLLAEHQLSRNIINKSNEQQRSTASLQLRRNRQHLRSINHLQMCYLFLLSYFLG